MTSHLAPALFSALVLAFGLGIAPACHAASAEDLLGVAPPAWEVTDWLNSEPLDLEDLEGRAVLVRWFMDPRCPYCSATAPSLVDFHQRYAQRGLTVLGFYHHKDSSPLDPAKVAEHVEHYGFEFPVAIDREWKTLESWWLDRVDTSWTSVSFLVGRDGKVHHIHPGGQYVAGDADHAAMEKAIEEALADR